MEENSIRRYKKYKNNLKFFQINIYFFYFINILLHWNFFNLLCYDSIKILFTINYNIIYWRNFAIYCNNDYLKKEK